MGQVSASNWAQVSGSREQNIDVNNYPSAAHPHWQPRYGMAVVKVSNISIFNDLGNVLLMGGDVYDPNQPASPTAPFDERYGGGYKNDVWQMTPVNWQVLPDQTGWKNKFGQKLPRTRSTASWSLIFPGGLPPPRVTYDQWIACEPYFSSDPKYQSLRLAENCASNLTREVVWSPRRHHASVLFNGYIYVMGGRARELVEYSENRTIGGIIGPRVNDVDSGVAAEMQYLTTQREASIPKSDVWKSVDGIHWSLVTPGCKAPQSLLVPQGNARDGKFGKAVFACQSDADCYGAESCDLGQLTCVCSMWTSREQHALAVHGDYMYLTGGYASYLPRFTVTSQLSECGPYPCGDTDASAYRYNMNDVWRSIDGANWELVTASADFPGRGGHQMLAMVSNVTNDASLWIFGGRGVDPTQPPGTNLCFNDMWTASLSNAYPSFWTQVSLPISGDDLNMSTSMPWTPRLGHTVTLETATASNGNFQTLHLVGGRDCSGNVLDEVWSWRTDDANSTWILDFTHEALYSTTYNGSFGYYTNSPLVNQYITPNSDVSLMQQYSVPSYPVFYPGVPLQRRVYLSDEKIAMLRSVGINTIQQFASADKYTILKLRGFDIPQVPLSARLHFNDVCNYRSLALNLVKKCSLTTAYDLYYDEKDMPWNVKNVFGGPPPSVPLAAWHGVDYNALYASAQPTTRDSLISSWDGCSPLPGFAQSGYAAPNVPGIGIVTQVAFIADSNLELENLGCRQTPGPRAHHAAVSFQGQLYIFGGKVSDTSLRADTWYRDSNLPSAFISTKPATRTSSSGFSFSADKSGCYFEYRIWRPADYELVREWTPVVYHTDVAWMDSRKGGPGKGLYAMYVRAIDPAGNRDVYFSEGKNVYTWVYVSPTPWDIIGGAIGAFFGLLFLVYFEYRRRRKKAAMERYALKRMRRKFKAMQKDADDKGVDWRTLYEESKQESAAVKRKKMLKRARDVNKERLDKDADRRDKEKEAIKIKMKEKREILRKRRLNDGGQYGFGERTDADLEVGKSAAILKLKSVAAEDLQGPSRLKKTREKRRKPGGYNESDYVEDENATGPALLGNGMVAGVVKRKAVASKRTKEFRLEDPMKDDGNKKQT